MALQPRGDRYQSLSGPILWALYQPREGQVMSGWGQVELRLQDQAGGS